jgi:Ca2+-transporting ATPase
LLLTYPSRHTETRPLANPYLHAAVIVGVGLQGVRGIAAADGWLARNARLRTELRVVVFRKCAPGMGLADRISWLVWRRQAHRETNG